VTGGRQGRYVGGRKRLLWGGKRVLVKSVQISRLPLPWGRDGNMALDLQGEEHMPGRLQHSIALDISYIDQNIGIGYQQC